MSTNLNMAAAPAAGQDAYVPNGQRVAGGVGHWFQACLAAWREALALRRSLREISQLSERELADIGLQADEIVRLRAGEFLMPRSWRQPPIGRDQLPF